MEISEKRIREGFPGQRSVVLPRPIVASWLASGPLIDVVPSDVGFYPHAKWHFVERSEGISQAIIIYCADGDGWGQLGDSDVFPVRSGEALLIPRDTIHTYGSDAASPWTIYWVHVSGPKAETLLPLLEVNPARPVLFLGRDPALASLFEKILSILGRGYSPDSLLQASIALGQLITHFAVNRYRQPNNDVGVDQRVERLIDRMHKNLSETFHIEDLASDAHLSRSHFAAVFKRRTGFRGHGLLHKAKDATRLLPAGHDGHADQGHRRRSRLRGSVVLLALLPPHSRSVARSVPDDPERIAPSGGGREPATDRRNHQLYQSFQDAPLTLEIGVGSERRSAH